ncbi:MAG: glycosyltransferase family 4 protein [Gemmatimonadetes bacterium]|nr:glycosyltransferase family 4 protein [Gemmatimonadota bacterium]
MSAPRILMISGAAPPIIDGVGHYAARLLHVLRARRPTWRWLWLARRERWYDSPLASYRGISLLKPHHAWNRLGTALGRQAVRLARPDLVHVQEQIHSFYETGAAARLAEVAGCPIVTTLHELHAELPSVRHTVDLVRRSAAVVANDRRTADRCREIAGRQPDECWWSGSNVTPPEPAWNVRAVPGVLTTFGQINHLKSLDVVGAAFERLLERRPHLQWRIVGPFAPRRLSLHAELARRFSRPEISFTGALPDLDDRRLRTLLGESQAMLLPFADGASVRRGTLQAAWALGLPVLTTPPPAEEPAIVDGENCLLVRGAEAGAWAAAIERLLTDRELEARLRGGSLRTAAEFSWARLAGRHLDLYDRLLARPS